MLLKCCTYKIVIDAGLFIAITGFSKNNFPLSPSQVSMPGLNGKIVSTTIPSTAYHQVSLTSETQKLVAFVADMNHYK